MIAVHSCFVMKAPEEFLAEKDYVFSFANDSDNALMALAGGTATLPRPSC